MGRFIEFDLYSDALCMGERVKGGLFRPCAKTIRYSQISGALRKKFGAEEIHAAGYLLDGNGYNKTDFLTYAPKDKTRAVSKIPLRIEFLTNVRGRIYVFETDFASNMPDRFELFVGALISKGLGLCKLTKRRVVEDKPVKVGLLRTRIPLSKLEIFNIKSVLKPVYGYLFEPTSLSGGVYVKSLFEGSEVVGPEFLVT